ncbi:putative ferric-chelate reductase 1 homolog isoform X2 [Argiope bruennichi]|uniref:putative ferric-chelate reductase 1 homolog isoform X2 n=1 Tax=Argiope bruennichi TaxID=94029 RepID=UPI002493F8A5|nr:putative ferric-chelate reductase 1 homolog isoform X2 [Argiope bruennichi]
MPLQSGLSMGAFVFIWIAVLFLGCECRPDGAPLSACSSLTPKHSGIAPQQSVAPYSVSVSKHGNKVRVKLFSSVGEEFEGFVLQARYSRDRSKLVEGHFTTKDGETKTINCFNGKQNTLTMVNPTRKREVVTDWTPNTSLDEDVIFRATFAKTFALFWTGIDSSPVRIQSDGPSHSPSRPTERKQAYSSDKIYVDCSISKGCFGIPGGCINRQDCEVLLSYAKTSDGIEFKMHGTLDQNTYMAMGLSTDQLMGEDLVTECVRRESNIIARRSWNVGGQKSNVLLNELPDGAYESEYFNDMSTCSFTMNFITDSNGRTFNLVNNTYYTLLAKGPMRNERLSYHTLRASTQDPVNFNAFEVSEGEGVTDSVKIHGTFMVTAWVGLVSIGILLARHFKPSWENRTLCGVKIWFALHRGLMLVALTFVVIAFIVIFVHKNGWNYETDNPHAVLGCIATVLGLLQPIMALFRPGPDHPKRPIFNWLHLTVGNVAQLLAVVAIFYAKKLETSGLGDYFYAVMAVFVIVYLLFHLFFQVHTWTSERKKNNEVKMLDLASRGGNIAQPGVPEKNHVNQAVRQIFLGIYVIFVVAILIALYAMIGAA